MPLKNLRQKFNDRVRNLGNKITPFDLARIGCGLGDLLTTEINLKTLKAIPINPRSFYLNQSSAYGQ